MQTSCASVTDPGEPANAHGTVQRAEVSQHPAAGPGRAGRVAAGAGLGVRTGPRGPSPLQEVVRWFQREIVRVVLLRRPYGDLPKYFPTVTLHFEDADMVLPPSNYLFVKDDVSAPRATRCSPPPWAWPPFVSPALQMAAPEPELATLSCTCPMQPAGSSACLGWTSGPQTILGDIVLHDLLVTFDIDNDKLGWAPFDCKIAKNNHLLEPLWQKRSLLNAAGAAKSAPSSSG